MADISKCPGTDCEIKEQCYRFTSRVHPHWQSWIEVPLMRPCDFFKPVSAINKIGSMDSKSLKNLVVSG